ncbi:hypothetical protein SPRG_14363 [Saprolegnia parasitica CBS 223.65]|uniref:Uncharacterized protein n=1 Tax=Saprolegnia parasitica (strain CBS 223.65) TaxID=695850 RepID=A0A067BUA1_SAPPC|nr:hypothetical protein SPRG_14363 [Saprolegnia parasitica CBS 223.65]KDO20425.1 hypothetical protein SPRG_14363 [Saprolegnia parasitica CBS 223.65]|eukprot:XP_012208881.1 hypothetical protein SPRG_14363 [Saprolegnia parasitica CBS 223.65]
MKDLAAQVVGAVHEETLDAELLAAVAAAAHARPDAVPLFFQDVAHMLAFGHPSSSSSSESDSDNDASSSGSEPETIGTASCIDIECALNEAQVVVLLQYALPILTSSCLAPHVSSWGTLALLWCEHGTSLALHELLKPFLQSVCRCQASDTTLRGPLVLDRLVAQVLRLTSPEQTTGYAVLLSLLQNIPGAVFAAMNACVATAAARVAVVLGCLATRSVFPTATFYASPLWPAMLHAVKASKSVETLVPCLWLLTTLLPSLSKAEENVARVLQALRHAVELCAPATDESATPNGVVDLFSTAQWPLLTEDAMNACISPTPGRPWRVTAVDVVCTPGTSRLQSLRLTTRDLGNGEVTCHGIGVEDEFLPTQTVAFASDEVLTAMDVGTDASGAVCGLRCTTTHRTYDWLGLASTSARRWAGGDEIIGVSAFVHADGLWRLHAIASGPTPQALTYISGIFQHVYAANPWACVDFLRDETTAASTPLLRALCLQVRLHPGLVSSSPIEERDVAICAAWVSDPYLTQFQDAVGTRQVEAMQRLQHKLLDSDYTAKEATTQLHLQVEKDTVAALHDRLHAQSATIQAYEEKHIKMHQALQLRLAQYALECKLLKENNLTLRHEVQTLEAALSRTEAALQHATAQSIALLGENEHQSAQLASSSATADKCASLERQIAEWREYHATVLESERDARAAEREELIAMYEEKLFKARDRIEAPPKPSSGLENPAEDRSRILELEKLLKQKEQGAQALRAMLERQQSVSEEMLKAVNRKYDNVKAINLALQRRALGRSSGLGS